MGKQASSAKGAIDLKFDGESRRYYIVWEPVVIGMGGTEHEALEDLREAAHFGVDTLVDLKSKDIIKGKGEIK